ncbi:MAG TPA: IS1182 family transposase [Chitinophagales bacterium]|nr:IS1182 family transposase [Chitinophagales bacterium]
MSQNQKVVFKNYVTNQPLLLPPSLEELIPANHPVRVVNSVIDQIDLSKLLKMYKGGGTSSYHPRMLLKVLVYSYLSNIYSSRKIEAGLQENIHFMWLAGMQQPDHNTINRYRTERLKDVLKTIFAKVVQLLSKNGHLSLKEIYTDGTKIEANANRYTFVWGNSVKHNRHKMEEQLRELWAYSQNIATEELKDTAPIDFKEISPDELQNTIEQIHQVLKKKDQVPSKVKQKLNYIKREWSKNLSKYKEHEAILGQRKSYSKTDKDATFMRMKEDHMKNGQLKPGYNLQISSNNQYIVNYSLHQNPTDTRTLASHLLSFKNLYKKSPKSIIADAGYGSEENYELLEKEKIKAFIKYNSFDKEQRKKFLKDNYKSEYFAHDTETDTLFCPADKPLHPLKTSTRKSKSGYLQTYTTYKAVNCKGCGLRDKCHQSKDNRKVEINHQLKDYKAKVNELLKSETGIYHRKKRAYDVEPVFANIKHNKKFKRFNLRGIKKVEIETGLIALAHNLKKMAA